MTLTFHSFSTCSPYLVMLPLQATEKLQPPSTDRIADSQPPPALPQLSKSPGKSFLPAVPSASKMKPSLSFHAGMRSKKENSKLGLFCISAPPLNLYPQSPQDVKERPKKSGTARDLERAYISRSIISVFQNGERRFEKRTEML